MCTYVLYINLNTWSKINNQLRTHLLYDPVTNTVAVSRLKGVAIFKICEYDRHQSSINSMKLIIVVNNFNPYSHAKGAPPERERKGVHNINSRLVSKPRLMKSQSFILTFTMPDKVTKCSSGWWQKGVGRDPRKLVDA